MIGKSYRNIFRIPRQPNADNYDPHTDFGDSFEVDRGVAGEALRHVIRDLIMPDQKVQPDQ